MTAAYSSMTFGAAPSETWRRLGSARRSHEDRWPQDRLGIQEISDHGRGRHRVGPTKDTGIDPAGPGKRCDRPEEEIVNRTFSRTVKGVRHIDASQLFG